MVLSFAVVVSDYVAIIAYDESLVSDAVADSFLDAAVFSDAANTSALVVCSTCSAVVWRVISDNMSSTLDASVMEALCIVEPPSLDG